MSLTLAPRPYPLAVSDQNHNAAPGPIYDGNGYTRINVAIQTGPSAVEKIIEEHLVKRSRKTTLLPTHDLNTRGSKVQDSTVAAGLTLTRKEKQAVNAAALKLLAHAPSTGRGRAAEEKMKITKMMTERSTGGATPLHMWGMSRHGQYSTRLIIRHDGEVEAFDTYGFTPLHRMCQNNLAVGAKELLDAGAMVNRKTKEGPMAGKTPMQIAKDVKAFKVIRVRKW